MIDIIRAERRAGYPTPYLIARLRARHAARLVEWQQAIVSRMAAGASDERIWSAFLRELEWLHVQMNRSARADTCAMFGLFELKTIVLSLRNRAARRLGEVERLLAHSLLSARLREILLLPGNISTIVTETANELARSAPAFGALHEAYATGNLKRFENALLRVYLEEAGHGSRTRPLQAFFRTFIDARNAMIAYKAVRWSLTADEPFVHGGSIPLAALQRIVVSKDASLVDQLIASLTGVDAAVAAASEPACETLLLRQITRWLERSRRDDGMGSIAAYAWRCYVAARNLAVLHHGADVDPDSLAQELIA